MPALGKVKSIAGRVVCSSNIRQNGQAFFLYASDNDGELYKAPTATAGYYHNSFYSWGGVTMDFDYGYLGAPWNRDSNPYERGLNIYLPEDNPVYICNSDPKGDSKVWAPFGIDDSLNDSTQAYYTSTGTSYQYNAYLLIQFGYNNMAEVQSTSRAILVNEWPAYDVLADFARPESWTDYPRWSFHDNSGRGSEPFENDGNGNNTCFVDGHVEYIEYIKGESETSDYCWYKSVE